MHAVEFTSIIINCTLQTDAIYFNISSKAFDTVYHSILLSKLWSVSIPYSRLILRGKFRGFCGFYPIRNILTIKIFRHSTEGIVMEFIW